MGIVLYVIILNLVGFRVVGFLLNIIVLYFLV